MLLKCCSDVVDDEPTKLSASRNTPYIHIHTVYIHTYVYMYTYTRSNSDRRIRIHINTPLRYISLSVSVYIDNRATFMPLYNDTNSQYSSIISQLICFVYHITAKTARINNIYMEYSFSFLFTQGLDQRQIFNWLHNIPLKQSRNNDGTTMS